MLNEDIEVNSKLEKMEIEDIFIYGIENVEMMENISVILLILFDELVIEMFFVVFVILIIDFVGVFVFSVILMENMKLLLIEEQQVKKREFMDFCICVFEYCFWWFFQYYKLCYCLVYVYYYFFEYKVM